MLQYNEIKEKKIIIYGDEPCEVVEAAVARKQQMKPQNQTKLRSLISGKTFAATFHLAEIVEEAEIIKSEIKFLYHHRDEYWFCQIDNPAQRFKIGPEILGSTTKFLKANTNITVFSWDQGGEEKIIKVALPIKVDFKVKEAPPAVRGDTSKGGTKFIVLENDTTISAPMFIKEGDIVRINTETGQYTERV
jgi:elongation factor P